MSLSSPYGQNGGGNGQSPLGGSSLFSDWGNQNQGAMTGSGLFGSPTPQASPAPMPTMGSSQAPPGVTAGATPSPTMGSVQASPGITSGANMMPSPPTSSAVNSMVNALANPTPAPVNPASFAPQNPAPAAPAAPQAPANPLSFLGAASQAAPAAAPQPQNLYGF